MNEEIKKEYTTFFFDYNVYHEHKVKIKKIISKYGLMWNFGKVRRLVVDEMNKVYEIFNVKIPDGLKNREGSSGVWENDRDAVKIIMFEKKEENEHLPILMIYKGVEGSFYDELFGECSSLGCEIGKVGEGESGELEIVFKKKVNVRVKEMVSDISGIKEVMKRNFMIRIESLRERGEKFSEEFIDGWIRCIDKYTGLVPEVQTEPILNIHKKPLLPTVSVGSAQEHIQETKKKFKIKFVN